MADNPITQEEIDEGLELLRGNAVVQLEPAGEQIIEKEGGEYEIAKSLGWVKFSVAFRQNMLRRLKGPALAIFVAICLHVNEKGVAFPGLDTLAEETGYTRETVMETIPEMEKISGLLDVARTRGRKNVYRPAFAARGKTAEPVVPKPVGKYTTGGVPANPNPTGLGESGEKLPVNSHQKKRESNKERENHPLNFKSMSIEEAQQIPTLRLYWRATDFWPGSLVWELVDQEIRNNHLTEEVIHVAAVAWAARGYKPENVAGILEWAKNGITPNKHSEPISEYRGL